MDNRESPSTLTEVELKRAFRQPGCPLCRLRREREERYLFHLLYENVNDPSSREHLARGMGLCTRHAWELQAMEQHHWHDGMVNGILYEDLAGRVLDTLTDHLTRGPASRPGPVRRAVRRGLERLHAWLRRQGGWGARLSQRLPAPPTATALLARLSPAQRCRVCQIAEESEASDTALLVQRLSGPEFRAAYAASDGLCLPHLRRALLCAEDEETARFLAQSAADRLAPLRADLQEYTRKHSWERRGDPRQPWEQASWIRAVAFFAGEPPAEAGEDVHQARQQALATAHDRPDRAEATNDAHD